MVGVAWSKGCATCKKRKIRCSLEQPQCQTCVKSNRECGGYQRSRVFVLDSRTAKAVKQCDAEAGPGTVESKGLLLTTAKPRALPNEEHISPFNFWPILPPKVQGSRTLSIPTQNAFTSLWSIKCPTTRFCYRQQILSEFLYFQYGGVANPSRVEKITGGWLTMLPSIPDFTISLEAAVLAVCTARLGRENNDQALVRESQKFYTQGLRELQRALWSRSLMYRDETLAACIILLMYEVVECPDKSVDGWLGHIRGCAKLVELRGPKSYGAEFAHRLFVTFRHMEIHQANAERRSTFLSQPVWRERPWRGYLKSSNHELLDLMAEMASISEAGYYPTNPINPILLATELIAVAHRCWELDAKLQAFYTRLKQESAGQLYWDVKSDLKEPLDEEHPFRTTCEFQDLGTVNICIEYWASCTILWSGMIKIYEVLEYLGALLSTAFTTNLPILEHRIDVPAMATTICRSLPYYQSQLRASSAPPTAAVFPLKIVIEGLAGVPEYEKELAWAVRNYEMMIGTGVQLLGHLGQPVTRKTYLSA